MLEERFVLKDSMGLHARPAAQLMMALKDIQSAVTISGNGEQVDGKDVIQILSLGCVQGDQITFTAEGPRGRCKTGGGRSVHRVYCMRRQTAAAVIYAGRLL